MTSHSARAPLGSNGHFHQVGPHEREKAAVFKRPKSLIVILAAFAASACGSAPPESAKTKTKTTITMWSFLDPAKNTPRERVLRTLIQEYERAHPGVKVRVEPQIWHQIASRFTIAASTGNAPDIAWINFPSLALPISAGVVADLREPAFGHWKQADWEDYITLAPFDAVTFENKILAAPIMMLSSVLLYRRDMFSAEGIKPEDIKTWDGLLQAGVALTKHDRGGSTWGLGFPLSREGASQPLAAIALVDLQPRIFDGQCTPTVATSSGERTITMAADLVRKGAASPETGAQTSDDSQELFIAGRQAMTVAGTARVASIRERAAFDPAQIGVLPWPSWKGEKPGSYILDGWAAVVWKDSPNLRPASDFVAFLAGREAALKWTVEGGQVPLRKSVLARPEMAVSANSWMREVANGWARGSTFLPPQCNVAAFYSDFNIAVQKVVRGDTTPAVALMETEIEGRGR